MAYQIINSVEAERGCGYRKGGGLYLVSGAAARPCGKLPIELTVCPCCDQGIKQHRGISWVTKALLAQECSVKGCLGCHPFGTMNRFALMWVGERYYKTSLHFMAEADRMGISKRIPFVPKEFVVGQDWVLLAHPKCVFETPDGEEPFELKPGIFSAFCPQRIEYIVTGEESDYELQRLADRGLTLVRVIPEIEVEAPALFDETL